VRNLYGFSVALKRYLSGGEGGLGNVGTEEEQEDDDKEEMDDGAFDVVVVVVVMVDLG
jgi:hypothetical protein